jgi:hypothetical protein
MKKWMLLLVLLGFCAGCSTLGADRRAELDRMADQALAKLVQENPGLQGRLNRGPGYLVIDWNEGSLPLISRSRGRGVVVDRSEGARTYVKVDRLDLGGGRGFSSFKVLLIFSDPVHLQKARSGSWVHPAATAGAEESGRLRQETGYAAYVYSEGGASATYTLDAIRLKPFRQ